MKFTLLSSISIASAVTSKPFFSEGNPFYHHDIENAVNHTPFDLIHHPEHLHPHFAATYKPLTALLKSQPEPMETNDHLLDSLLISPRKEYHGLLFDEITGLMNTIANEFPELVKLESIGKTYDDRDIWMMKVDGTHLLNPDVKSKDLKERKAILLTGAHHSRELVSSQMGFYAILDLLHGYIHKDQEKIKLLSHNKFFNIPMVNADGCWVIFDHWRKTKQMLLKRKNNNHTFDANCPLEVKGVDINRNYGYIYGNNDPPCGESFPGAHAFSEPETRAMRNLLDKYQDDIKFVYNFHAYGPMWVWPYNGENVNELHDSNPDAQKVFNEIWEEAKFPTSTLHGNAIDTVGYLANGEANDYIMKAFNIPSISPELGNDNYFSGVFYIPYNYVVREVLRDNTPWLKFTFQKLSGQARIEKPHFEGNNFTFDVSNIGLQDWDMKDEGIQIGIKSKDLPELNHTFDLPNFETRQKKSFSVPVKKAPSKPIDVTFAYQKFGSDTGYRTEQKTVDVSPSAPTTSILQELSQSINLY